MGQEEMGFEMNSSGDVSAVVTPSSSPPSSSISHIMSMDTNERIADRSSMPSIISSVTSNEESLAGRSSECGGSDVMTVGVTDGALCEENGTSGVTLGNLFGAASSGAPQQQQLLIQAQKLLAKHLLYQKIDFARQRLLGYQTTVYTALPRETNSEGAVTAMDRDATVASLRFFNIFCNGGPRTFSLAVSLLDRLIGSVKVHPSYMPCVGTCCFFMAAKSCEPAHRRPDPVELLRLSRCGGGIAELLNTERLICEALRGDVMADVTALDMLRLFYEVFEMNGSGSTGGSNEAEGDGFGYGGLGVDTWEKLVAKLEVLMCQFEFTRFRGDVLALALISYYLQERGILSHPDQFSLVVELQYYCQISDIELMQCRGLVIDYLAVYRLQPSRLPRIRLAWCISRRTLHKMRPSTRAAQDLEPIVEDEPSDDEDGGGVSGTDDDSGPFDSENDDTDTGCDSLSVKSSSQNTGLFSAMSLPAKYSLAKTGPSSVTNQKRDTSTACVTSVQNREEGYLGETFQKGSVHSMETVVMDTVAMGTSRDDQLDGEDA